MYIIVIIIITNINSNLIIMKNLLKIFRYLLICFGVIMFFSCDKENESFVTNEISSDLEKIITVPLYSQDNNGIFSEVTTTTLKNKWENQLMEEYGYPIKLVSFEMLTSKTESGIITYFLKAVSEKGGLETGSFLEPAHDKNISSIDSNGYILGSKTCSCTGCSNGCHLIVSGDNCRCSPCPVGGPQGCSKKEEIHIQ